MTVTIEIPVSSGFQGAAALRECNRYLSTLERRLYVDRYIKKKDLNKLKSYYIDHYRISGRHFNSIASTLDARMKSKIEISKGQLETKTEQVKKTRLSVKKIDSDLKKLKSLKKAIITHRDKVQCWREGLLKKSQKKPKMPPKTRGKCFETLGKEQIFLLQKLHQKKRRLGILEHKKKTLEDETKRPSICFGSKSLLSRQHHLGENGYKVHQEWKDDWDQHRNSQSFWLGSHDESFRNLNAQLSIHDLTLSIRLPYTLKKRYGDRLSIPLKRIPYLKEKLQDALLTKRELWNKRSEKWVFRHVPVTYRILERKGRFSVHASFEEEKPETKSSSSLGAIGVDLNADHLAVSEVDRFGNPIRRYSLPFKSRGVSSGQLEAQFGDHIAYIVDHAVKSAKPVICEKLDFSKKKMALRESGRPYYNQMLSSFAYKKFYSMLMARASRHGVRVKSVNAAFTSIIGYFKFKGYSGYSSHELAALSIARRGLRFSERPKTKNALRGTVSIPGIGDASRLGHVWSWYSRNKNVLRINVTSSLGRLSSSIYNPRYSTGYFTISRWGYV